MKNNILPICRRLFKQPKTYRNMGLLVFSSIDSISKIMNDTPFRMVDVNTETLSDWSDELQNNYEVRPANISTRWPHYFAVKIFSLQRDICKNMLERMV